MSTLTFGIIKPDAVRGGKQGTIIQRILDNGFNIRGMKLIHQTKKQAEGFYAVHAGKGFYEELTDFMSSGPCVVLALEKDNAVPAWRELIHVVSLRILTRHGDSSILGILRLRALQLLQYTINATLRSG